MIKMTWSKFMNQAIITKNQNLSKILFQKSKKQKLQFRIKTAIISLNVEFRIKNMLNQENCHLFLETI